MLTLRRVLRSRPELNSGSAHIFWYIMDEHMHIWSKPRIMCSYGSHELFLKRNYIIFESWIEDLIESANHNTMKCFEAFNQ